MKVIELLASDTFPPRNLFSLYEVCDLLKITYEDICYWESLFPQASLYKSQSNRRLFSSKDIVILSSIKHLVFQDELSVADAQKLMAESYGICEYESISHPTGTGEEDLKANHMEAPILLNGEENRDEDPSSTLESASRYLMEHDGFDELTQQLYDGCGDELVTSCGHIEPCRIDARCDNEGSIENDIPADRGLFDYENALALLSSKKSSLHEVLSILEKYDEENCWIRI